MIWISSIDTQFNAFDYAEIGAGLENRFLWFTMTTVYTDPFSHWISVCGVFAREYGMCGTALLNKFVYKFLSRRRYKRKAWRENL